MNTMMKKLYTCMTMAVIAISATVFTACEREAQDREEARTLEGTWTGYIDVYYADRWGWTGDTYRTSFYFYLENPYGGWGYEADYNSTSAYSVESYYSEFRWNVTNGVIRIEYADPSWNPIRIYNYTLYGDYFSGYMDDGTRKDIYFQLYYDGNYNWSNWSSWHNRRSSAADTNSVGAMDGEKGTRYFATGKYAERIKSLQHEQQDQE